MYDALYSNVSSLVAAVNHQVSLCSESACRYDILKSYSDCEYVSGAVESDDQLLERLAFESSQRQPLLRNSLDERPAFSCRAPLVQMPQRRDRVLLDVLHEKRFDQSEVSCPPVGIRLSVALRFGQSRRAAGGDEQRQRAHNYSEHVHWTLQLLDSTWLEIRALYLKLFQRLRQLLLMSSLLELCALYIKCADAKSATFENWGTIIHTEKRWKYQRDRNNFS